MTHEAFRANEGRDYRPLRGDARGCHWGGAGVRAARGAHRGYGCAAVHFVPFTTIASVCGVT